MTIYAGYYEPVPEAHLDDSFRRKVVELPQRLPAGCLLVGSYVPAPGEGWVGRRPPPFLLVETDHPDGLEYIRQYYAGYLRFEWAPLSSIGATHAEREAWAASLAPAGTTATPTPNWDAVREVEL